MEQELESMSNALMERSLRVTDSIAGSPGYARRGEHVNLNLSSNDYLGLSQHPAILKAMSNALFAEGAGSGASRYVTGNRMSYERLEEALAEWQRCESALVFANGYMANTGAISTLVGKDDVVFSDRLNHASIVDGIARSRAEHARYRHNDIDHLRTLLNKYRNKRRKLIVTDAVFSMDGDKAPLRELIALKHEYGAMLMVDEAHSGGVYGERGEGLCHELGLHSEVDIHMGTFSKAFGVYGAYICGSRTLIRWLVNKARPLIYSTALPPAIVAGVSESLVLVQKERWRRERIQEASRLFRSSLSKAGFKIGCGDSPVVPLVVGDNGAALRFSRALEEKGILAVAIRPPTVPAGAARLRFSLSSVHTDQELTRAVSHIHDIGIRLGVLNS